MNQQEHVFLDNGSVRVSDSSVALRKGGVYPLASLSQVTFARLASKRLGTGLLVFFGLLFLVISWLLSSLGTNLNDNPYISSYQDSVPYEVKIGLVLLLLAVIRTVFQIALPVYVVLLKGTFGSAQPLKSRNRRHIEQVVVAIQQAMHQTASGRNVSGPIVIHNNPRFVNTPTFNNNLIRGSFNDSSDIAVGNDAQVTRPPWADQRFKHSQGYPDGQQ